jgi:transcription antitermination factor NusG
MEDYKDMDEAVGTPRDRIIVLDTISRGRTFSVLKARRSTKFVTLKVANTPDAMYSEMLRREYELGSTLSHGCIATTLGFEEETENSAPKPKVEFRVGDNVRITGQVAFMGYEGVVESVDMERQRVKVSVNIFGRSTPTELDFNSVERFDPEEAQQL